MSMVSKENPEEELASTFPTDAPLVENGQLTKSGLDAYCENELYLLDRKLASYLALPAEDKKVFTEYPERLQALADCITANGKILATLAQKGAGILQQAPQSNLKSISDAKEKKQVHASEDPELIDAADPTEAITELRALFSTITVDWSADGKDVREKMYTPLIDAVEQAYEEAARAFQSLEREKFRVLVPHAGVGRLCWELVSRGFSVEGCESSLPSILASNYFLNHASTAEPDIVYPFAHEHRNVRSGAEQTRGVAVPDVSASATPIESEFGMRTGAFLDLYNDHEHCWDAVVSCFAFDLEDSIIAAIRRISHVLSPGGVWAFLGPVPCAHEEDLFSAQLAVSEFVDVVKKAGFRMLKEQDIEIPAEPNAASLKTRTIRSKLFVAVKVRPMK